MGDEGEENGGQGGAAAEVSEGQIGAGLEANGQPNAVTVKVGKRKNKDGSKGVSKKKVKSEKTPTLIPVLDEGLFDNPEDEPGSIEKAKEAFQWLVGPTNLDTFYKEFWEKKPLHMKRDDPEYYKTLFSTKALDKILREQRVVFGKNLDVTSYSDGKRETHNPGGRVFPPVLWDFYNNGCSVRMLNPQTFHPAVWRLCSTLQDHFGSMVGANVYLTPPGTQGFAPHWDDVEVFMCQLEGSKHWRLYGPREEGERLPRFSSPNFDQDEVGEPILDTVLYPGDLLYLPRGTIHQGNCLPEEHSLHITISCYQLNSWTDLLEKLLPAALAVASADNTDFREGLPRDYLSFMGVAHEPNEEADHEAEEDVEKRQQRKKFLSKLRGLVGKLSTAIEESADAACDQMGKRLMAEALPPALEVSERARTVAGDGERWHAVKKTVVNRVEIDPDTHVRLIRATACRLVQEDDTVQLYYSTENTREFKEVEEQSLEVGVELAPAVEHLIGSYPKWTKVEELPVDELEDRMKVVGDLWERGILMTSEPLEAHYDDP